MKASLKIREEGGGQNPLLRAKIPVTVLGVPFISAFTAGDPSDLSFHLRTASINGPSLKLSYAPNDPYNPFALSLKSGIGIWGSPDNSPLIMQANFPLFGKSPNPSFSLQISPQFGDFSFKKTALSTPLPNPNPPTSGKENGDISHREPLLPPLTDFQAGECFFSGMAVTARTVLPVAKRAAVKFRWGVNFPAEFGRVKLPFLTVDKISVERGDEQVMREIGDGVKSTADSEVLKGICYLMKKEVEVLQKENRWIKESLEELRSVIPARSRRVSEVSGQKSPEIGDSGEFERWRKKKSGGGEGGRRETTSGEVAGSAAVDVGEELKKAIEAASSPSIGV
eukprot:TRINITY_DN880_c0_g1_i2.p1 TRINITY_DN880_c0_g1~~TRINITY_DN880_c0_g1_i2.p1  ORF type:complete len:339 (-),score=49.42 TRINITY_DN880_c0_g1_i2:180-1196(-)